MYSHINTPINSVDLCKYYLSTHKKQIVKLLMVHQGNADVNELVINNIKKISKYSNYQLIIIYYYNYYETHIHHHRQIELIDLVIKKYKIKNYIIKVEGVILENR